MTKLFVAYLIIIFSIELAHFFKQELHILASKLFLGGLGMVIGLLLRRKNDV